MMLWIRRATVFDCACKSEGFRSSNNVRKIVADNFFIEVCQVLLCPGFVKLVEIRRVFEELTQLAITNPINVRCLVIKVFASAIKFMGREDATPSLIRNHVIDRLAK